MRTVLQVEMVRAASELTLRGLQPGTKYKVRVRVKLDGISYSGYWSAWSEPVFIETPPAGQHSHVHTIGLFLKRRMRSHFSGWDEIQPFLLTSLSPSAFDLLIVSLAFSVFFVLIGMFLTMALSHRRSVTHTWRGKVWSLLSEAHEYWSIQNKSGMTFSAFLLFLGLLLKSFGPQFQLLIASSKAFLLLMAGTFR